MYGLSPLAFSQEKKVVSKTKSRAPKKVVPKTKSRAEKKSRAPLPPKKKSRANRTVVPKNGTNWAP